MELVSTEPAARGSPLRLLQGGVSARILSPHLLEEGHPRHSPDLYPHPRPPSAPRTASSLARVPSTSYHCPQTGQCSSR